MENNNENQVSTEESNVQKPTEGRIVTFFPSERTLKQFEQQKKSYPAIVTEVNQNSVDLTVFAVGETVYVTKVQHKTLAPENRSSWDWPARV